MEPMELDPTSPTTSPAATLSAVASPRRREILRLLWTQERAAGEIHAAMPDVTFGAVSLQLRRLAQAAARPRRPGPGGGRAGGCPLPPGRFGGLGARHQWPELLLTELMMVELPPLPAKKSASALSSAWPWSVGKAMSKYSAS